MMRALAWRGVVAYVSLCATVSAGAQTPVGALAVDERRGDQYGWAVDYESEAAAWEAALSCGAGCSVVLTFARCGAYAADQNTDSTALGWAESYASAAGAQQAALSECRSRGGGSGCIVRAWGCNGPVVEEGLGLDRATRRLIQQGLGAEGFDAGVADGLFGPRTRAAIRGWQSSRGMRPTGYLNTRAAAALRDASASGASVSAAVASESLANAPAATLASGAELEGLFWQSIVNSMNPADFEAYLEQFPNGVFRALAQIRLVALRGSAGGAAAATGPLVGGVGSPASGARVSGAPASVSGTTPAAATHELSGVAVRPSQTCAGEPAGAACWMEISEQPGCHLWNPGLALGATVTWTGQCVGGFAQGTGTMTWVWDENRQTETGRLVDGKQVGHWVIRHANGRVDEGPFVDGKHNGRWVIRHANGTVSEGPTVDGKQNGRWVIRFASGNVEVWLYEDGEYVRTVR